MDRHDCPGALEDFRAAEEEQPNNALAFASAGLALLCEGDAGAASQSFARARELDPTLRLPR
jgi:lipoprotein NlpI